jgi:hypothetical protein
VTRPRATLSNRTTSSASINARSSCSATDSTLHHRDDALRPGRIGPSAVILGQL